VPKWRITLASDLIVGKFGMVGVALRASLQPL